MATGLHDGHHVELPAVASKLVTALEPAIAHVVANEPCTFGKSNAWIRNIALDVSGTKLAHAFHAGQAFGVLPPGVAANGRPHKVRLYSIASPEDGEDGNGAVICTPVKRVVDEFRSLNGNGESRRGMFMGVCSNYLCDLEIGDPVRITGPVGKRFLLPVDAASYKHVFIATGTGIAPFRGMVLELLRASASASTEIWLLMGSPYTSDLLYHTLFLQLAREHDNFHYRQALSREPGPRGAGVYVDELIELEGEGLTSVLAADDTVLYLCGLVGMQWNVFRRLARLGLLASYANVSDELEKRDPKDWTPQEMKQGVKPGERCMIEVY